MSPAELAAPKALLNSGNAALGVVPGVTVTQNHREHSNAAFLGHRDGSVQHTPLAALLQSLGMSRAGGCTRGLHRAANTWMVSDLQSLTFSDITASTTCLEQIIKQRKRAGKKQ